jgi:hypothetical protein
MPSPIPVAMDVSSIKGNTNSFERKKFSLSGSSDLRAGTINDITKVRQSTDPQAMLLTFPSFSMINTQNTLPVP